MPCIRDFDQHLICETVIRVGVIFIEHVDVYYFFPILSLVERHSVLYFTIELWKKLSLGLDTKLAFQKLCHHTQLMFDLISHREQLLAQQTARSQTQQRIERKLRNTYFQIG